MMRSAFFLIVCVIVLQARVTDWAARSGFQLLSIPSGAASVGRGNTGVAVPGVFARYTNPAQYGDEKDVYLAFEHVRRIRYSDMVSNRFEFFVPVKNIFLNFSASNVTVDGIYLRDFLPGNAPQEGDLTATWQFSELALTLGLHRTPFFDWAITLGTAFDRFEEDIAFALLLSGGFSFRLLDNHLRAGLSLINWGLTTPMINEEGHERFGHGEDLPSSVRGGLAYMDTLNGIRLMGTADVVYAHLYDPDSGIVAQSSERFEVPIGIEVSPVEWFTVRAGKTINGGSDLVNFGCGFKTSWLTADLGVAVNRYETSVEWEWLAGVKLQFASTEEDPEKTEKKKRRFLVLRPKKSASLPKNDSTHKIELQDNVISAPLDEDIPSDTLDVSDEPSRSSEISEIRVVNPALFEPVGNEQEEPEESSPELPEFEEPLGEVSDVVPEAPVQVEDFEVDLF